MQECRMLTMHCVDCWHLASSEVRFEEKMSKKEVAENLLRSSLSDGGRRAAARGHGLVAGGRAARTLGGPAAKAARHI